MYRYLQFVDFLDSVGLSPSKKALVTNWFFNFQRDQLQEQHSAPDESAMERYLNEILKMFKEHPDLPDDTYKNYIRLAFEKIYKNCKSS